MDVLNEDLIEISVPGTTLQLVADADPYIRKTGGRVPYDPISMSQLPQTKVEQVSMVRAYKGADDFYAWRLEVEKGNIERRDVTVAILSESSEHVRTIILEGAWPSKWELPVGGEGQELITLNVRDAQLR